MLERIIEKSKTIIKTGKNVFCIGLASLTLLYASGCATGTFKIKTDWVETSREERTEGKKIKEIKTKQYKIKYITLNDNNLQALIEENFYKEIFNGKTINTFILSKEFDIFCNNIDIWSQRKIDEYIQICIREYDSSSSEGVREWIIKNQGKFTFLCWYGGSIKVKAEPTGEIKQEILEGKQWEMDTPIKEMIYQNYPSQKVKVNVRNYKLQLDTNKLTDKEGLVTITITTPKDWDFNKDELITKIKNYELVENIKEPLRTKLLPSIEDLIKIDSTELDVETKAGGTADTEVTNDRKTISALGFYIDEKDIYPLLKEFIDQEINSKIKETTIITQDKNSHVEIPDVKVEMNIEGVPTKRDLADDYFTGKLLEWAIKQIKDYNSGKFSQYTDRQGTIKFNAYLSSKFKFETKHTKYHAFEKSTDFKEDNLEKTVRLIDIGEKLRVEQEEKKGGELIEK